VKEIRIEHGRTFYDTDISPHYHLYFEDTGQIHSIPADLKALRGLAVFSAESIATGWT
jgi:Fe2+ or Zn2+ uptake regulation protein